MPSIPTAFDPSRLLNASLKFSTVKFQIRLLNCFYLSFSLKLIRRKLFSRNADATSATGCFVVFPELGVPDNKYLLRFKYCPSLCSMEITPLPSYYEWIWLLVKEYVIHLNVYTLVYSLKTPFNLYEVSWVSHRSLMTCHALGLRWVGSYSSKLR